MATGDMTDGIKSMVDYSGLTTNAQRVAAFKAAIPDPDTTSTSGSQQGIPGYLDEMSPMTAAQLRAEIDALNAVLAGGSGSDAVISDGATSAAPVTGAWTNTTTFTVAGGVITGIELS